MLSCVVIHLFQPKKTFVAAKCKKLLLADRTSIIGLFPNWKCLVFTFDDPDIWAP